MNMSIFRNTLILIVLLCINNAADARRKHPATGVVKPPVSQTGLDFIENKGQWVSEARFKADIPGGVMFLTDYGFVYNYANPDDLERVHEKEHDGLPIDNEVINRHAYKVKFVGASVNPALIKNEKKAHYHNYFIGNDKSKWAGKVGVYGQVGLQNIYEGVNVAVYSKENSMKYDLIVAANANPSQIKFSFDGITPTLNTAGDLVFKTSFSEIKEKAPYTYQVIDGKTVEIKSSYTLNKGVVSFDFPEGYNKNYELIIDPVLVFASFSGATGTQAYYAYSTTYDITGNTYTAALGGASSANWPVTTGAFQEIYAGSQTACIAKINATGSAIVYATYFGGSSGNAQPNTLRVTDNGELFIAGSANSPNIPLSSNPYQATMNGSSDIYLARFSADGSALLGSTYIGGSGIEASLMGSTSVHAGLGSSAAALNPVEITFDNNGSVWLTSNTGSTDFPVTANAAQSANAGSHDAVIVNISANCSNLIYSTYFGGTDWDGGNAIEINPLNNQVYASGYTTSATLPNTTGSLNPTNLGGIDGFVTTYNASTLANLHTTFLGTTDADNAHRIAFDSNGDVFVAGRSLGGNYPVSANAYSVAGGRVFVQKLNPTLTTALAATTLGSTTSTSVVPSAMIIDNCGNLLLATIASGSTSQAGMPLSPDAFQTASTPFWFCALTPNFGDLFFGSYFGGSGDHYHPGVARMDPNGIIYHSVCAAGDPLTIDFPTTSQSFSPNKQNGNTNDNITFKFNFEATGVQSDFVLDPAIIQKDTGCVPFSVSLKNLSSSAVEYIWDFGDNSPTSNLADVTHTFTAPGIYTITLYANNDTSCVPADTAYMTIVVLETNLPNIIVNDTTLCHFEQQIDIGVEITNPSPNNTISWGPATGLLSAPNLPIVSVDPSANSVYWVTVKDTIPGICGFSVTDTIHIDLSPRELSILTSDTVVCEGAVIPIVAIGTPGYTYRWSPSIGVSDTTVLQPNITINQPNIYTLTGSYQTCLDTTVSISIGMHYQPSLELGANKAVCQWTEVALESMVTPFRNDYIYQWSPVNGLSTPNAPTADFLADTTATYYLNVQTPIGCSANDSITILVYPGGFGGIIADTGYCPPNQAQLWATGGTSYAWSPAYGLSDTTSATPIASPHTTTDYTVLITDIHNCVDTEFVSVQVYPVAVLSIPDSVTVYPGEQYHVQPESNCLYFQWFPPSGLSNANIADPLMSPSVRTRYFVTGTTEHGCSISDSMDVLVSETVLDMPNAFSPNSNNVFKPAKRGIAQLKSFSVYNRWGNKVFTTSNIEEGWDGNFNGKPQPLGVYMYIIEAVADNGKQFTKQGNVTLIR